MISVGFLHSYSPIDKMIMDWFTGLDTFFPVRGGVDPSMDDQLLPLYEDRQPPSFLGVGIGSKLQSVIMANEGYVQPDER